MKIKWKKSDDAVSEVIGAILMVGIGVALFSLLYFIVMSYPFTPPSPSVDIVGTIEGNSIILEHRGGDSLDLDTTVSFAVGGTRNSTTVDDYLIDSNENGRWDIGERLVIPCGDMTNLQVEATVVDMDSNSIVIMAVLQEGETTTIPSLDTSVDTISPYVQASSPLAVYATGDSGLDNVTLYHRWSDDNISWNGGLNEVKDPVDNNTYNMDGIADKGSETNFPNAQDTSVDANVMTIQEADQGYAAGDENKVVDSWDSTYVSWTETGTTPYLNADDYSTNYITIATRNNNEGWFTFADTTAPAGATVTCTIYVNGWRSNTNGADDYADVYVDYTGNSGSDMGDACTTIDSNGVQTINVGSLTVTQANTLRVYFRSTRVGGAMATLYIDYVYVRFQWSASPNYNIDFEYQWTVAVYNQINKQVCLYVASHTGGTENLLVNYRNGSIWSTLGTITTTGWSNFTATGLISSTYTIQLKGATESGDLAQDSWNIDVIMLNTWNTTGGLHGQNWIIWPNAFNPDSDSPWSWNFNFPKGVGYYEFYSRGMYDGAVEGAPASADSRCRYT
jgi:FlaG/FlaF family flagellin (archaellin)